MPEWMIRLLMWLLPQVSEELRTRLVEFAQKFREDARETENPLDDLLADIICWIFQVP